MAILNNRAYASDPEIVIDRTLYSNPSVVHVLENRQFNLWIQGPSQDINRELLIAEYWGREVTPNTGDSFFVTIGLEDHSGSIVWNTDYFSGKMKIVYLPDLSGALVLRYPSHLRYEGDTDDTLLSYFVDLSDREVVVIEHPRNILDGGFTDNRNIWLTDNPSSPKSTGEGHRFVYSLDGKRLD